LSRKENENQNDCRVISDGNIEGRYIPSRTRTKSREIKKLFVDVENTPSHVWTCEIVVMDIF